MLLEDVHNPICCATNAGQFDESGILSKCGMAAECCAEDCLHRTEY